MTDDLRTAAQQALARLQYHYAGDPDDSDAIATLRAALDQQAVSDAALAQPEPVAWLVLDEDGLPMYAAAWREAANEHINDAINEHDLVEAHKWRVVPVYAHPPAPQPAAAPGWKLVPVEPTRGMALAFFSRVNVHDVRLQPVWEALLAAAPRPPQADAAMAAGGQP